MLREFLKPSPFVDRNGSMTASVETSPPPKSVMYYMDKPLPYLEFY